MISYLYVNNGETIDPAANLALEEYALRQLSPENDYLILYRNAPSVIVGRNQNVLEEVNDAYVRKKGIPVFRRISGGGTVYHEPGNLNFSFITRYEPSRLHNYRFFNEPVVQILRSLGVPAEMNDRNDILADGRKISGNAQFSSKGRMISHGTLLFDADLEELDRVLEVRMKNISSRSQKSVRSHVANISEFLERPMNIRKFHNILLKELLQCEPEQKCYELGEADRLAIQKLQNRRYRTWEWNVARSPRFQIHRSKRLQNEEMNLHLEVEKGRIRHLDIQTKTADYTSLVEALTGVRYDPDAIAGALNEARTTGLLDYATQQNLLSMLYGEDEKG